MHTGAQWEPYTFENQVGLGLDVPLVITYMDTVMLDSTPTGRAQPDSHSGQLS
jgi:hypothetical protein